MKKENNISGSTFEETCGLVGASPMTETEMMKTNTVLKNSFFKDKYRNSLKTLTKSEMKRLEKQYPEWHLKDILIAILKDYNSELPTSIWLEMTQYIISEWERSHHEEPVLC